MELPVSILKEGNEGAVAAAGVHDDGAGGDVLQKTRDRGVEVAVAEFGVGGAVVVRNTTHVAIIPAARSFLNGAAKLAVVDLKLMTEPAEGPTFRESTGSLVSRHVISDRMLSTDMLLHVRRMKAS